MFQLYKSRTFGEYVSETFDFLRADGKHFFTQFFTILGVPILILGVLSYLFQFYSESLDGQAQLDLLSNDLPTMFLIFGLLIIFMIIFSIFVYSFPVLYLKLYQEKGGAKFETSDILNEFKNNFGRIFLFFILTIFANIVIFFIAIIPFVILTITIIGIFAVFFLALGIIFFNVLSFYIYLNNKEIGYLEAIGIAFQHIKKNFWATIGAYCVMYLLVIVVSGIFAVLGGGFDIAKMMTIIETGVAPEQEEFSYKTILKGILLVVSQFVSSTLANLPILLSGLVYYSMQEHKENYNTKSEIDLIGTEDID